MFAVAGGVGLGAAAWKMGFLEGNIPDSVGAGAHLINWSGTHEASHLLLPPALFPYIMRESPCCMGIAPLGDSCRRHNQEMNNLQWDLHRRMTRSACAGDAETSVPTGVSGGIGSCRVRSTHRWPKAACCRFSTVTKWAVILRRLHDQHGTHGQGCPAVFSLRSNEFISIYAMCIISGFGIKHS